MNLNLPTIAMISDDFLPAGTGVGIHVQKMSREMAARGHRVIIITTRRTGQPATEQWEGVCVYRVFSIPIFKFYQALPSARQIQDIFLENNVGIVHCHYLGVMMHRVMRVAKRMGIPAVLTTHMTADHLTQPWLLRPWRPLISRLIARVYEHFSHVICVSSAYAKQVERFSVHSDVHYISNPIDFDAVEPLPVDPSMKFKVLFAGRLNPEKNITLLLKAFHILNENRPETELLIAGQGDQEQKLRQLTASLGLTQQVKFLGYVPHNQLPQLYSQSDVFVLPSLVETQGLVALEAMRFHRPVIVTNRIVSAKELVDDGQNGFIVDAESPEELALRLQELYDSPELRQRQGSAGFKRSLVYTVSAVADDLEKVYQRVSINTGNHAPHIDTSDSKRTVCTYCHIGTFERRAEHMIIPSNAKHFQEEYFAVWRCAFCRSIHSFAKFPLDDYYLYSPFKKRQLNYFNRQTFENLYRWLLKHEVTVHQRTLLYGLNSNLFQTFFKEKGFTKFDTLEEVMNKNLLSKEHRGIYDNVIIFDFLERAEDTNDVFEFAKRQLVDNGRMIIHTPDADRIKLPLNAEQAMHQPFRIHIPSWIGLKSMAENTGFTVHHIERRHHQDTLIPFINFKTFHDLSKFHDGSLESAINFHPMDIFKKSWRIPRFIFLGLFGGILKDGSNLMIVFKKTKD